MQRREMLGLLGGTMVMAVAGCAERQVATDGNQVVAGISSRAARELARANDMLGQRPLAPAVRRNIERGKVVPAETTFRPIPDRMARGLPAVDGLEWRAAGIDLVLLNPETGVVEDILIGPLR